MLKVKIEVPSHKYYTATEFLWIYAGATCFGENTNNFSDERWKFECQVKSLLTLQEGLEKLEEEFGEECVILGASQLCE